MMGTNLPEVEDQLVVYGQPRLLPQINAWLQQYGDLYCGH